MRKLSSKKEDDNAQVTRGYLRKELDKQLNKSFAIERKHMDKHLDEKLKNYPTKAYFDYELSLIKDELGDIQEKLDKYIDEVLTYKDYLAKFMNDFRQEMLFLGNRVNIHDEKIEDNTSRISILEDKMVLRDGPVTTGNKKIKP